MPLTPFHLGPGLLVKSLLPRQFSLLVFILTQVLIDCEPLYFILTGQFPVHRILHTYVGATVVAVGAAVIGRSASNRVINWYYATIVKTRAGRMTGTHGLSWSAALAGAFIGAYSHVALDSLMHADLRPFYPLSQSNPLLDTVSWTVLHLGCLLSGVIGLVLWMYRRSAYSPV